MLDESFRIEQLAENTVSNQQMEILNQMNSVISRPNGRRRTSTCVADEFDDASRSSRDGAPQDSTGTQRRTQSRVVIESTRAQPHTPLRWQVKELK